MLEDSRAKVRIVGLDAKQHSHSGQQQVRLALGRRLAGEEVEHLVIAGDPLAEQFVEGRLAADFGAGEPPVVGCG